jgi:phage I-like protein
MSDPRNKKKWPDEAKRKSAAFAICKVSTGLAEGAHQSYAIDISGMEFEEDSARWIHLLPYDTINHPEFGELDFNQERINRFHENAEKNVRGVQLDIDYEHKQGVDGGRAAGWILRTEVRDNGLWGLVEFTKKAASEIKDKVWKYFSPEFDWEWEDGKGNTFKDVLYGGALTNRPFLKTLVPINLSEHWTDELTEQYGKDAPEREKEVNGLDPKELRKLIGLSEDASDDAVKAKIKELNEGSKDVVQLGEIRTTLKLSDENADSKKVLGEVSRLVDFFKEHDGGTTEDAKKFEEQFPEQHKQLQEQATQLQETTVAARLSDWSKGRVVLTEDGKAVEKQIKRGLAPINLDDVKEYRFKLKGKDAEAFDSLMGTLLTTGFVPLGEDGSSHVDEEATAGESAFLAECKKYQQEQEKAGNKVTLAEASKHVSREKPELAKEWQREGRSSRTA